MLNPPKILKEDIVYQDASRFKIRRYTLQFGRNKPVVWEYPEIADGVAAVPLLPDGRVILAREWRTAWKQTVLQIPGGKYHGSTEREQLAQLRKELREEIGMDARSIRKLTSAGVLAGVRCTTHIYLATDLIDAPAPKGKEDEHEYIEIVKMPLSDALELFLSGREFTTAYTLIGLLLAQRELSKGYETTRRKRSNDSKH